MVGKIISVFMIFIPLTFHLYGDNTSLPAIPRADYKVLNSLNYADNKATRAEWHSGDNTESVVVEKNFDRNILKLRINFKDDSVPRTIWDLKLKADFSNAGRIKLRLFCPEKAAEANLVIYFQSGKGWYRFNFYPEKMNEWSTVTLDPRYAAVEGKPSGWDSITTMRISVWRTGEMKTDLYICDLGYTPLPKNSVLIIRADSCSTGDNSCQQYAAAMAGLLDRLHIPNRVTGDINWGKNRLKKEKLVILPLNPSFPENTEKQIFQFIKNGGKVLCFYSIPEELSKLLGFEKGKWLKHSFTGFKINTKILPGAPESVKQHSWNIYNARPVENKSKIAAYWYDADGKTKNTALIVSDNAVYLTHVLLDEDPVNDEMFIVAALNYLLPDSASERAGYFMSTLGNIGNFKNYKQAVGEISKYAGNNKEAAAELKKAALFQKTAETALNNKNYRKVYTSVKSANTAILNAYFAIQKPEKNEFRGFWCHSPYGIRGLSWDSAIKKLADNGFTAIFPNMAWGGTAYYNSSVLPVAPEVAEKGDQIKQCLAACRKYHIQCHIWKVNWNTGNRAPAEFIDKLRKAHRLQVGFDGKERPWLCPSDPKNRELEIASMIEIAKKYKIDGIHFDYIRYPGNEYCFCEGCRKRFAKFANMELKNWPQCIRKDKKLHKLWLRFRRGNITKVVSGVRKRLKKSGSNVKISAAVFSNWANARDSVGQDWVNWCRNGLLDFVCPMDYTENVSKFTSLVKKQLHDTEGTALYPGIGISCWERNGPVRAADIIKITRRLKTGGFMIFQYDEKTANELIPLCGKGLTGK